MKQKGADEKGADELAVNVYSVIIIYVLYKLSRHLSNREDKESLGCR
jgi:hypothetical protein